MKEAEFYRGVERADGPRLEEYVFKFEIETKSAQPEEQVLDEELEAAE